MAETNCNESKGHWFGDRKERVKIHWSSDGKGAGVALIITNTLNKYVCNVKKHEGRAISVMIVLPRKTTICLIQVYLPSKNSEKVDTIAWVKNQLIEARRKNYKIIVMGDFNAVPSPSIDRNNNSNSNTPESSIFPLLTGMELIDCFRTLHPDSGGFTWQRDNSWEKSRIDAIWVSQKWGNKLDACWLEELNLITDSDHKLLCLKMRKSWQLRGVDETIGSNGPKYNMKLMSDEKWSKFNEYVEKAIDMSSIVQRQETYELNFNTLNKTWETLKNVMIEAADRAIPKTKGGKKRKVITKGANL